ncbi:MAG: hypothetical protein EXS13_03010 [Planctomycetes bacterium]|nr:hypothetical protein [Planctomycetota bacterium]
MTEAAPTAGFGRRGMLLLAALLVLGLGLRLVGLSSSFWIDEVDTLVAIVRQPLATIVISYGSENQHPLYSVLARLAVVAFGESEAIVRLPALLFGVASLFAVARLGRQLIDETTGLLAALLLAVSAHHVWFSQNARGYTGMLLFTVLATSEFLRLLSAPTRRGAWRYALFAALAAYTHLTAVFAFVGHALVWAGLRFWPAQTTATGPVRPLVDCAPAPLPRATATALAAMGGAAALALLLYAPLAGDLVAAFTARASGASVTVAKVEPWTSPLWAVRQMIESLGVSPFALIGIAAAGVLALIGTVSLWRNGRRAFVLMHLLAPPLALAVLLTLHRHLYPRFFFFEAGFVAIVVVRGARISGGWLSCNLPGCKVRRTELWGIAVVLAVAAASSLSLERVYAHPKQDFVGARDLVEARAKPNDARVAVGPAKRALPDYYAPSWTKADTAADLAAIRAAAATTWLVYTLPEQLAAARPDVWEVVQRDFEVVAELPGSMGGGTVFVARAGH